MSIQFESYKKQVNDTFINCTAENAKIGTLNSVRLQNTKNAISEIEKFSKEIQKDEILTPDEKQILDSLITRKLRKLQNAKTFFLTSRTITKYPAPKKL